ncbi:hypothetical protein ACJX0J_000988 (mitochondrion) [Zea mays]
MNLKQNFGQMTVSGCKEDKRWIGLASLSTQSMGMQVQYLVRWLIIKQDRETVLQFMLGVAAIYNRKHWHLVVVSKQDTGISIWFRAIVNARNMHEYLAKQKAKGRHVWYKGIRQKKVVSLIPSYLTQKKTLNAHMFILSLLLIGTVQDYNMKCDNLMRLVDLMAHALRQSFVLNVSSIFLGALLTHSMWAGDNREWKNNELSKKMDAAPFFQGIRIIRKIFTFLLGFLCLRFAAIFFNLLNNRATSGAVNGFTEYKEELMDAVPGIKEKELGGIFHLETSISVGSNLLDADYPSLDQIQFNKEQENFILKSVNLGFLHPLVL